MPLDRSEIVVDGARLVLRGEVRAGYEKLLGAGLEAIERGVRRGLQRGRPGGIIHESDASLLGTVDAFLRNKFPTEQELLNAKDGDAVGRRRLLEALTTSRSAVGLLARAAENFTIDRYRRLREMPEGLSVDIDADGTLEDSGPAPDAGLLRSAGDARLQRYEDVLTALPLDDRALVLVCHGAEELPLDVLRHISGRRRITEAALLLELSVRAARFAGELEREREALERLMARLTMCQTESAVLRRWVLTDDLDVEDHGNSTLDAKRREALLTKRGFRSAAPGERRAIFLDLEARQTRIVETLAGCRERLATLDPTRPNYEEVALLLGLLQPSSGPADRKRVINTITVRVRRLRSRLADIAEAIDGEDDDA